MKILKSQNIDFTKAKKDVKLTPWQVTGLVDGEGSFNCYLKIVNKSFFSNSIIVKLEFKVTQKAHSEGILYDLQNYFKCGTVVIDNRETNTKKFHVTSLSTILEKIIPHFDSYPCLTSKFLNWNNWKEIALIVSEKGHNSYEGISRIKYLLESFNKKRSFNEKYEFCNSSLGVKKQDDGEIKVKYDLPSDGVQTFLTSECTFYTYFSERKSRGNPYQGLDSSLELAQNSHDVAILLALKAIFNGGYIKPKYDYLDINSCINSRSVNRYILRDTNTIIQFVDKYPMLTRKHLDYIDWKEIVNLKSKKAHQTTKGAALINNILSKMNSKRA